jgi:hypothetical protein
MSGFNANVEKRGDVIVIGVAGGYGHMAIIDRDVVANAVHDGTANELRVALMLANRERSLAMAWKERGGHEYERRRLENLSRKEGTTFISAVSVDKVKP